MARDSQRQRVYDAEDTAFGARRWATTYGEAPEGRTHRTASMAEGPQQRGLWRGEPDGDGVIWRKVVQVPREEGALTLDQCQALATRIDRWLEARGVIPDRIGVRVTDGRGRRRAGSSGFWGEIKLPRASRTVVQVIHEMAHQGTRSDVASHGPEFARLDLALVQRFMGSEDAATLRAAFRTHRVRVAKLGEVGL